MDPSIWTGVFVLLIVLIILGFIIRSSRSKENKFKKRLKEVAAENAAAFTNYEVWPNGVIAIDTHHQHLIFITTYQDKEEITRVHLQDIKETALVKDTTKTGAEQLLLKLTWIASNQPPAMLCFYNSEFDGDYTRAEFQVRLEKWRKLIAKK
jgi:hypothetical protein